MPPVSGGFSRLTAPRVLRPYQLEAGNAISTRSSGTGGDTFTVMMARQSGKNERGAQLEAYLLRLHADRGGQIVKAAPIQRTRPATKARILVEAMVKGEEMVADTRGNNVMGNGHGGIRVCVAGITGWTGKPLAGAIAGAPDLQLASGVSRSVAGQSVAEALQIAGVDGVIFGSVEDALDAAPLDVLVDFTSAEAVKDHVLAAIQHEVCVVIGSSGLTADDYAAIEPLAVDQGVGVVAMANASIMAALLQHLAVQAAEYLPSWEVIDYASAGKIDVPSGTSRQLAERISQVRRPVGARPIDELLGPKEARGASVSGTRIHSIRLPSYVVSTDIIFGQAGERLILRHEAGESAAPYVGGTLLAIREVVHQVGLIRGLDALLFPSP